MNIKLTDEEVIALINNLPLKSYIKKMEEMAGMPKEDHGKRQPGERGMYERTDNLL